MASTEPRASKKEHATPTTGDIFAAFKAAKRTNASGERWAIPNATIFLLTASSLFGIQVGKVILTSATTGLLVLFLLLFCHIDKESK